VRTRPAEWRARPRTSPRKSCSKSSMYGAITSRQQPGVRTARPASAFVRAGNPYSLCESQRLCSLHALHELSVRNDNCKHGFAEVYSTTLRKGKPVERRGRKASGPMARGRRIAGLPAPASPRSGRHTSLIPPRFVSSAARPAQALRATRIRVEAPRATTKNDEEQRKLNWANPSKGGDAKPPVYRTQVLRQRGCHMSRVIRDEYACAQGRSQRPHSRAAGIPRPIHAAPSGAACVMSQPLSAHSTQRFLRAAGTQFRCEP
jgi:hypothetical protein